MAEVIPTHITTLLTGARADRALDQITGVSSSRREVFIPTLDTARHGFGVPGRLAPPSARGLRAWVDGTEELRLRLERFGWSVPASASLDGAGVVVSPDSRTAIAMVSGDGATGREGYLPQVKYPRGKVAVEFVQGSLFLDVVAEEDPMTLIFLLHDISLDGWRAELSVPTGIGKGGWITGWRPRIQIVADNPDAGDGVSRVTTPELPTPIVRWRESA